MLELIYVEKIIKFYLDLIAGSKGLIYANSYIDNLYKYLQHFE